MPAPTRTERGRGRRATRTAKVADGPAWIDFTGATQVAQLRRTVTTKGRRTVETVYLITSADARTAPPEVLATWVQTHLEIENRLHRVRDVYKQYNTVERCITRLKQWRGLATRYDKTATIYLAGLHIAAIFIWSAR
jgi:transposase